jgi:peptide/nickel transport system ATP-binding protein
VSEEVLRIRNLRVVYSSRRGYVNALRKVDLEVKGNEVLGIVGESGSGKTTLALTIIRQLPSNSKILSGSILFNEGGELVDLLRVDYQEFRRFLWSRISYVPQGAMNSFNPVSKIKEHFIETAKAHYPNMGKQEILSRAEELLKVMLLDPKRVLESYPHQLSGGMRQRTLISLALLLNPKVVIMDEPTSSLDVVSQKVILQDLRRVLREFDVAVAVITHDMGVVAEVADRVAVMYAGNVVEVGHVEDVFYNPLHPYTQGLMAAVPKLRDREGKLISIPGSPPDLVNPPRGCSFHPRCPIAAEICRTTEPQPTELSRGRSVSCFKWNRGGT